MKEHQKHILVTGTHRSGTAWVGRTLSLTENVELVYEPFNLDTTRYSFEYKFDHWFEHVPTSEKYREIEKEFVVGCKPLPIFVEGPDCAFIGRMVV